MKIKIEVDSKEAMRVLKKAKKGTKVGASRGIKTAGFLLMREIKESIAGRKAEPRSVDTGRFLSSVQVGFAPDNAVVYSDVNYGKFLEYGTSKMHERRHFRNSAARKKKEIQKIIGEKIKKSI